MKDFFLRINYKTIGAAIASLLTMLAVVPDQLGTFAVYIPDALKGKILFPFLAIAFVLRVWNSRKPPTEK